MTQYGKLNEDELHLLSHLQTLERNLEHMRSDLFMRVRTRLNAPREATVQFNIVDSETAYLESADV